MRRIENQNNQLANLKKRLRNPTEPGRATKRLCPGKGGNRPKGNRKGKAKGKGKRKGKGKKGMNEFGYANDWDWWGN